MDRLIYNDLLHWKARTDRKPLILLGARQKRYSNHSVRAFNDNYGFEMKSWWNPFNWGRNFETIIGGWVAGDGTPYDINIYGSAQLTPILPWIK